MPILPISGIHIFSDSYKIADFWGVQKVTIVVKKYVKKLSKSGQKRFQPQGSKVQRSAFRGSVSNRTSEP
jgi:hypothetical protein